MIASPDALGRLLRRLPPTPTSVAALLGGHDDYTEFRRVVREVFPESAVDILAAGGGTARDREYARVTAFLNKVQTELFPTYDLERYEDVHFGIPFLRFGWSYDRFHDLDFPAGQLLLFALCAQPYATGSDTRVPLLDALTRHLPRELVAQIPEEGFTPATLHERLDGTDLAAAAEFADWLWGQTDTCFLDFDDEVQVADAEWRREVVDDLAGQWRKAEGILDRVAALEHWLIAAPAERYARLLDAALGRRPRSDTERQGRPHDCEITAGGLVPSPHDQTDQDAGGAHDSGTGASSGAGTVPAGAAS